MNHYRIEMKDGMYNVYSPKIGTYVMENATLDEVKIALATEIEYEAKLKIVELLMTFPHGFSTMDGKSIVNEEAVEAYTAWYNQIFPRVIFLDEYYALIDKKIYEILP